MIALTPGGRLLDDALAAELAAEPGLTLLCGRYEGFDERIVEHFCTDAVSIGRYVLAGGELAAMVVCDAVLRKLPGALGHAESAVEESFSAALEGAPEYPHYTRPADWRGLGGARGPALRPPRADPPVAARAEPERRQAEPRLGTPRFATIDAAPRRSILARGSFFAMSTVIDSLERAQLRRVPRFQPGDRVKVHFQVVEGTRRRTQVFEGVVIKRQGEGVRETFTVRKQSFGVGVERTFPVHSPKIERIEVAARGDVRRAKLYYLRGRVGKRARVRERRYIGSGGDRRGAVCCTTPRPRPRRRRTPRCPARPSTPQALAEADRSADADGGRRAEASRGPAESPRPPTTAAERRGLPAATEQPSQAQGAQLGAGSLLELVLIVAVALGLALGIQAFLVKPYRIPSESMVPTLAGRPARARQPHRRALQRPVRRRRGRLPPARRRRGGPTSAAAARRPPSQVCAQPTDGSAPT